MKTNRNILFIVIGILAIFIIAMALSLAASSYPDGLEQGYRITAGRILSYS